MLSLRRELPLTGYAGLAQSLVAQEHHEDSPFRVPLDHCPLRFILVDSLVLRVVGFYAAFACA